MKFNDIAEKYKEKVSYEMFGTKDYKGALKVISKSSVMFRTFHEKVVDEYNKDCKGAN